jgi:hypothetical protein
LLVGRGLRQTQPLPRAIQKPVQAP